MDVDNTFTISNKFTRLNEDNDHHLRMGDQISLYSTEGKGYLSSEGYIDNKCCLQSIPDFSEDYIFTVLPKFKYDAHTAFYDALDRWNRLPESVGQGEGAEEDQLKYLKVSFKILKKKLLGKKKLKKLKKKKKSCQ